jgi:hypothetical protein
MALAARPGVRCDVVVFTGQERGAADAGLRRMAREMGATVVWSGRGSWAPREAAAGEWNVAEGAVRVRVAGGGVAVERVGE